MFINWRKQVIYDKQIMHRTSKLKKTEPQEQEQLCHLDYGLWQLIYYFFGENTYLPINFAISLILFSFTDTIQFLVVSLDSPFTPFIFLVNPWWLIESSSLYLSTIVIKITYRRKDTCKKYTKRSSIVHFSFYDLNWTNISNRNRLVKKT